MRFVPTPCPARSPVVLGICPGARRVGLAVLDAQELLHHQVLNLYQICSPEGKGARFRQVVSNLIDANDVGHVALTLLTGRRGGNAALRANLLLWLTDELRERGVSVVPREARSVRAALLANSRTRPSSRHLCNWLAERFPELHSLAPSGRQAPWARLAPELGNKRRLPSGHELYWRWMFTALAGALFERDRIIREELTS